MDHETIISFLDPIIRIRAIQNFSPSQAVSFIFLLKKTIRENIKKGISEEQLYLYMQCKEKIYDLKANEMRNSTYKAFKRAGLVREMPVDEPDIKPNINA